MMKFHGLIKSTFLDYPNLLACTLFTKGCNLLCPFCQNSSLVLETDLPPLDEREILNFLNNKKYLLDGVCITGGEPLMQDEIFDFCKLLKNIGYKVKVDTNGTFPNKLEKLIKENLVDYVAMDLKNSREEYNKSVGKKINIQKIENSVGILKNSNIDHEFRTTLVKELHDHKNLIEIAKWIGKNEKLYLQTFQDAGTNIVSNLHGFTADEEKHIQKLLKNYINFVEIRGI